MIETHTKKIGDRSVAKVLAALLDIGEWEVSIPWGDNCRYDLVIDKYDHLARVQVKTGKLRKGAVVFPTQSKFTHKGVTYAKTYTSQEIDFFGVYCAETETCYLVPVSFCQDNKRQCSLRVAKPKNNQEKNILWASDFDLAPVV